MSQTALNTQCASRTPRCVYQLGTWRTSQCEASDLILRLGTPDGFSVAFGLPDHHAGSLHAVVTAAPTLEQFGMRRPN
jgi:hypothetical protein